MTGEFGFLSWLIEVRGTPRRHIASRVQRQLNFTAADFRTLI